MLLSFDLCESWNKPEWMIWSLIFTLDPLLDPNFLLFILPCLQASQSYNSTLEQPVTSKMPFWWLCWIKASPICHIWWYHVMENIIRNPLSASCPTDRTFFAHLGTNIMVRLTLFNGLRILPFLVAWMFELSARKIDTDLIFFNLSIVSVLRTRQSMKPESMLLTWEEVYLDVAVTVSSLENQIWVLDEGKAASLSTS